MIELVRRSGSRAIAEIMLPNMIIPDHAKDASIAGSLRETMESCPPRTIEFALAAMRERVDQTDFLPSLALPTLIIVGDQDVITPLSAAETMNRAIARSTLKVISHAGHLSPLDNAGEVDRAMRDFVTRL
jgi:pimeloyl-ACP methyl ester carboxylesterase